MCVLTLRFATKAAAEGVKLAGKLDKAWERSVLQALRQAQIQKPSPEAALDTLPNYYAKYSIIFFINMCFSSDYNLKICNTRKYNIYTII